MNASSLKTAIKQVLGEVPYAAELYWLVMQKDRRIRTRFKLNGLEQHAEQLAAEVQPIAQNAPPGKTVLLFTSLHYWIEHAAVMATALAGLGHRVTLAYLPYSDWQNEAMRFDLRRQNLYARRVLERLSPLVTPRSFYDYPRAAALPAAALEAVQQVSVFDTQYTLQVEEVEESNPTYRMRYQRNLAAAQATWDTLETLQPQVVIVPNGTIQEMGVVYRLARLAGVDAITYEFGDQRDRIWLAQNSEVMQQETDPLWTARQHEKLSEEELGKLQALYAARRKGATWENFARRWQGTPAQGGEKIRMELGLDARPIVLLATNVLGDSLTLGRQIISRTMAEWIANTVRILAAHPGVQVVVRVHPGEVLTRGPSMMDVVKEALPALPAHFHLIGPREKVNTYDLIDAADLGLVYTTTVGMEMAMNGVPVIVAGRTHYRGRGFTFDPASWQEYEAMLARLLRDPQNHRLSQAQVEQAWHYAYRFFFEFPRPFPWHVVRLWEDVQERPLTWALSEEGMQRYANTFGYLTGEKIAWQNI